MKDYWVTVCGACLRASCWQGEFECDDSHEVGTVEMRAAELRALKFEHPYWYSRSRLRYRGVFIEEVKP